MESFSITISGDSSSFTIGVKKPFLLQTPLGGWGRPDTRTSSFENAGADGGQIPDQYYGMRQIPISFELIADTCQQHDELRAIVENSLPIRQSVEVVLQTPTGKRFGTIAKVIDVDPLIIHDKRSRYTIELRSPDSLLYDYTNGNALEIDIDKAKAGGFTLPVTLPVIFRGGSLPSTVTNSGTVTVKPLITLTGSAINPIITNVTTGQFIKLNLTMVEGDVVVIDTSNQTVTLNGGNIRNSVDPLSKFWFLPPGNNQIQLESTSQSDTLMANIKWFNGYLSI